MKTDNRFAAILVLAAVPFAALAADPSPSATAGQADAPPLFKELDKNSDGQINQTEAKKSADLTARFSTLDANNDKRISVAEWQAGEQSRSRGAAGASGESHEPGAAKGGQPAPEKY